MNKPTRLNFGVISAAAFAAAYMLAAITAAFQTGNKEFIFYIAVMMLLAGAVLFIHWRIHLSTAVIWMLAIWGGLHMAGGLVPVPADWPINGSVRVLYSWWIIPKEGGGGWLKFDHLVHAYGFATAAWLCWQCLQQLMCPHVTKLRPTLPLMILMVCASGGLGAMNEIVEFIATLFTETNVGDHVNTGWDLVANFVGAMIAAIVIWLHGRAARMDAP